jgi:hypothetical protein
MNRTANWLALVLSLPLAVATVTAATAAFADAPPAVQAKTAAPAPSVIEGRFQRYLVSPKGKTEGLLLEGGTMVRLPEQAFAKGAPELKAGDAVRVEGRAIKTPTGQIMMRALVQRGSETIADGRAIEGRHHDGEHAKGAHTKGGHAKGEHAKGEHAKGEQSLAPLSSTGKIVAIVSSPKGRVAGVVLDDGTTARAGRKSELGSLGLKVGDQVTLTGRGGVYPKGKGMMIEQVKLANGELHPLAAVARHHRGHARI